ncbi:MAG: acyl-CoA-binding protein [Scytonematopsis contorta HA4267-MV1]|jgi:chlorinating enzyme|nr:acyl-CoA-binding protein [Scytonematopsis contorta HA4267-MV1]
MNMLAQDQIKHFVEKGWCGPLDIFSQSEVAYFKDCLETNSSIKEVDSQPMMMLYNNVLNINTSRDLHLFYKPIAEMFKSPKIVRLLNQLGEPNLLLWNTNVFCKMPGEGEIKWHQVYDSYDPSSYDPQKPALLYPEGEDFLNLTVWVALDDATLDNGCLRFANNTHYKKFQRLQVPAEEGMFAGVKNHKMVWQGRRQYSAVFDFNENEWEVEAVPARAGQVIIFTERVMHCSGANNSNQRRLAINARYVRPSVQIYPHRLQDDFIDENFHNIKRHFCMLVSGQDNFGINVIRDWNNLDDTEVEFHNMSNLVRFGHVELPQGKQQIEIDSLYQQVMEGDCPRAEPDPIQHPRKYIQWQAWNQHKGMSRCEAMKRYSQLISKLPRVDRQKKLPLSEQIKAWLVSYVAELLKIEPDEVDCTVPFERYALGSADAASLTGELGAWLERDLPATLFYNYPNIETLANHLASERPLVC